MRESMVRAKHRFPPSPESNQSWPQFHEWGPWCQQPHPESPTSLRLMACDTPGPLAWEISPLVTGPTNIAEEDLRLLQNSIGLLMFKSELWCDLRWMVISISAPLSGVTSHRGAMMACAHFSSHQGASPPFLLSPGDDGGPIESQAHYC